MDRTSCFNAFTCSPSSSSFFSALYAVHLFLLQIVNSYFSQFLISPFYFHFKLQNISSKAIQSVETRYSITRKHLARCHGEPYGPSDCDNFPPHITHTQLASMSFRAHHRFSIIFFQLPLFCTLAQLPLKLRNYLLNFAIILFEFADFSASAIQFAHEPRIAQSQTSKPVLSLLFLSCSKEKNYSNLTLQNYTQ